MMEVEHDHQNPDEFHPHAKLEPEVLRGEEFSEASESHQRYSKCTKGHVT
jgi:hypothetical protein